MGFYSGFKGLKNIIRGSRFAKNFEPQHSVVAEFWRFSKVVTDGHTASHAKVEKVC